MIVLVTGVSGSGKSTLAANLSKFINAVIVPQDAFYTNELPSDNVETGSVIDWKGLCATVVRIHAICKCNVIVEGHAVFNSEILVEVADILVNIVGHKHLLKRQFMSRDHVGMTDEQLEMKSRYFDEKTWPAHEVYERNVVSPVSVSDSDKYIRVESQSGVGLILDLIERI